MMKSLILFFTTFVVLFAGCSKNDDPVPINEFTSENKHEYEYDANKVFKKSEIIGTWELIARYDIINKNWVNYTCDQGRSYIQLSEDGMSYYYNKCMLDSWKTKTKPKAWSFDDKNKFDLSFEYESVPGSEYFYPVTLSFYLVSASDNELIAETSSSLISGTCKFKKITLGLDDYYQRYTYGCKVKDTTNLTPYWYEEKEDKSYLIGMRDEKLWIGVFDKNNKEQLFEATDSEKFNWTKREHLGYGEYKDHHINKITIKEISSDYKRIVLYANDQYLSLWFTETNKKYDLIYRSWDKSSPVINWHNQSFLVEKEDAPGYTCLSEKGDVIFTGSSDNFYALTSFAINYYDYIRFDAYHNSQEPTIYVCLGSFKEKNLNKILKQLPYPKSDNYKMDISLLNRNENIFTFKIDITEYSGDKHSHTVDVDINAEPIY